MTEEELTLKNEKKKTNIVIQIHSHIENEHSGSQEMSMIHNEYTHHSNIPSDKNNITDITDTSNPARTTPVVSNSIEHKIISPASAHLQNIVDPSHQLMNTISETAAVFPMYSPMSR